MNHLPSNLLFLVNPQASQAPSPHQSDLHSGPSMGLPKPLPSQPFSCLQVVKSALASHLSEHSTSLPAPEDTAAPLLTKGPLHTSKRWFTGGLPARSGVPLFTFATQSTGGPGTKIRGMEVKKCFHFLLFIPYLVLFFNLRSVITNSSLKCFYVKCFWLPFKFSKAPPALLWRVTRTHTQQRQAGKGSALLQTHFKEKTQVISHNHGVLVRVLCAD